MSELILFQIDRKSGVRGTLIASDRGLHILAVNCHAGTVRGREQIVSIPFANRFVAAARARNGDGDVQIIIDAWNAEEWRQCADCTRVVHRDDAEHYGDPATHKNDDTLCHDCCGVRQEAHMEQARAACRAAGGDPDDPIQFNRTMWGLHPHQED